MCFSGQFYPILVKNPFELTIELNIDPPNIFEEMCGDLFSELERHGCALLYRAGEGWLSSCFDSNKLNGDQNHHHVIIVRNLTWEVKARPKIQCTDLLS